MFTTSLTAVATPTSSTRPGSGGEGPADAYAPAHVVPPGARFRGKTYGQWAAAFWKWALEFPLDGHPFTTCMRDFAIGQTGKVWFWSAPDSCPGPIPARLPAGTALFLTIRDVETSSLEAPPFHGDTEARQRANSRWWADHIVGVFCIIDGVPVRHLHAYRFSTPHIHFTAPAAWIFGNTGGPSTSVGDGYYVMVEPLSEGRHTIHYGGTFHFDAGEISPEQVDFVKDITIDLRVERAAWHRTGTAMPAGRPG
jgi:hypothetical protein